MGGGEEGEEGEEGLGNRHPRKPTGRPAPPSPLTFIPHLFIPVQVLKRVLHVHQIHVRNKGVVAHLQGSKG